MMANVIKIEQIEDMQGKKWILFTIPGMAAPDGISNCAIEITGVRKEIPMKNKNITVNLL